MSAVFKPDHDLIQASDIPMGLKSFCLSVSIGHFDRNTACLRYKSSYDKQRRMISLAWHQLKWGGGGVLSPAWLSDGLLVKYIIKYINMILGLH